jgi:hypothetical protein
VFQLIFDRKLIVHYGWTIVSTTGRDRKQSRGRDDLKIDAGVQFCSRSIFLSSSPPWQSPNIIKSFVILGDRSQTKFLIILLNL